jgi:uncharacterized protein (TIGR02453 family)
MATSTMTFEGFRPEAVEFLAELAQNNDRAWFQPRKSDYERLLKEPLEALCIALDERLAAAGVPLAADPARSPFRIYRDVRFSKDKSPYKTNIGASFAYVERGPDGATLPSEVHGPGGYFHLSPGDIFVGGGMWHPEKDRLAAWRAAVTADPERVHGAIEDPAFVRRFGSINGDRLTRVPSGFPADHPDAELLKLKDVTFGRRLGDEEAFAPDLPDRLAADLAAAVPVLRLLSTLAS